MDPEDPREIILEWLRQPAGKAELSWPEKRRRWLGTDRPWRERPKVLLGQAAVVPSPTRFSGTPFQADHTTIRFVKERSIPGRRLYSVTFEERRGRMQWLWDHGMAPWLIVPAARRMPEMPTLGWIVGVRQQPDGSWAHDGRATGGGFGAPDWPEPRVNFCGWGWPHRFAGGGRVHDKGLGVTSVRLRFANEVELEDSVDDGVVLFLTDEAAERPATAFLYDSDGTLVGKHSAFAAPELTAEQVERLAKGLPPEAAAALRARFGSSA